jgi:monofunctional biosynthetic peptidoglycan transglycosylase
MRRVLIGILILAVVVCAIQIIVISVSAGLPPVDALARKVPARTSLMRARAEEAAKKGKPYRVDQRWVSYSRISPLLRRAVLIAEDDAFFAHGGLDWNEIRASARANVGKGRVVRGGSTITQQLAKNLYLSNQRTITRKLEEVLLAVRLERTLTKQRIFELYLNLIEWGDGIYGAEAAARRHFGKSAAELTPREAALLASVIINPRKYSPVTPARRIEKRAAMILGRMARRGFITQAQYAEAMGLPPPPDSLAIDSTAASDSTAGASPEPTTVEPEATPEPVELEPAPAPVDTIPGSPLSRPALP